MLLLYISVYRTNISQVSFFGLFYLFVVSNILVQDYLKWNGAALMILDASVNTFIYFYICFVHIGYKNNCAYANIVKRAFFNVLSIL